MARQPYHAVFHALVPAAAAVLSAVPSACEVATPLCVVAWPAAEPWALPPLLAEASTLERAAAPASLAVACGVGEGWWGTRI